MLDPVATAPGSETPVEQFVLHFQVESDIGVLRVEPTLKDDCARFDSSPKKIVSL
jgi:hypothetical protein